MPAPENDHKNSQSVSDYVVCLASFFCIFLCDTLAMCFGILMLELQEYFEANSDRLSLVGSVFLGLTMCPGLVVGGLLERWSFRTVLIGGTVVAAAGLVLSSFTTSVAMLTVTYGVLTGGAVGIVYITAIVMVGIRFTRHRALATGIAFSGGGAGVFAMSYPIERLLEEFGWRGTLLILGGVFLNCCVFGAMVFPKTSDKDRGPCSHREEIEIVSPALTEQNKADEARSSQCKVSKDGLFLTNASCKKCSHKSLPTIYLTHSPVNDSSTGKVTTNSGRTPQTWCSEPLLVRTTASGSSNLSVDYFTDKLYESTQQTETARKGGKMTSWLRRHLELTRNSVFLILLPMMCLYTGFISVLVYLPDLVVSRGLTRVQASLLLSEFGITNVIGRVLCGALSDIPQVGAIKMYAAGLVVLCVDTALLPHCNTLPCFVIGTAVFSLCVACCLSLRTIVIVDVLGVHLLTSAFALICVCQGICYIILPPVCGTLYKTSGSAHAGFYLMSGLCGVAAIFSFCLRPVQRWQRSKAFGRR